MQDFFHSVLAKVQASAQVHQSLRCSQIEAVIQEEARHRSDLLDAMVRKLLISKIDLF